jgi:pimeloyl-ACP methyl ester carboxylesterase
MPDVHVHGVRLYFEEHGDGQPVLCIHGGGSSSVMWGGAIEPLARLGRVIVYDRRGCARSERPSPYDTTTIAEHADDAAGLLEALAGVPAIVIGRSYGGEIALELTHRHPDCVQALVLLDASPFHLDPEAQRWGETLKLRIQRAADHAPETVRETLIRAALGATAWESLPAAARELFTANGPAIVAEFNGGESDLDELALSMIEQPCFLVTAADSPRTHRRRSAPTRASRCPGRPHDRPRPSGCDRLHPSAIAGERAPPSAAFR